MINPKEKMLDQMKSQAVPFRAADETDIVAVAMAFGEEIQKHGDPAMAIYALKQQLAEAQAKLQEAQRDAERYRWLCQVATESQWVEFGGYTDYAIISKAIDQAMREG